MTNAIIQQKRAALAEVLAGIDAEIAAATRAARDAAEAATHEENKPEGDKDMRSTEASYIARGQAERVKAHEQARALLAGMPVRAFGDSDAIEASALVEVSSQGTRERYLLVPAAGGLEVKVGPLPAKTLATQSPLGRALLGLSAGDDAELSTPRGPRSYEIVSVV